VDKAHGPRIHWRCQAVREATTKRNDPLQAAWLTEMDDVDEWRHDGVGRELPGGENERGWVHGSSELAQAGSERNPIADGMVSSFGERSKAVVDDRKFS
jgi:hypothetical protein